MQSGWEDQERERVESLRVILEREQGRPVSYSVASEIGRSLIAFYEVLGAGSEVRQEVVAEPDIRRVQVVWMSKQAQ